MEEDVEVAADTCMEDPLEPSRTIVAQDGGAQLEHLHPEALLLTPRADVLEDDHSSASSSMKVADRLTYLEQRVQMQEDEIQLLKVALADVLKRLNISEEQSAGLKKRGPVLEARPVSLALSTRGTSNTTPLLKKGSTSTPPSSVSSRVFSPSPVSKSPPGSVKGCPSDSGGRKLPASITNTSTSRKLQERPKDASTRVLGRQHVSHCKVTMQIYLSPLRRRTGSTEVAATTVKLQGVHPPTNRPAPDKSATQEVDRSERSPVFTSPLQKSPCESPFSPTHIPVYKRTSKSSSQYFQICY
ncbi:uncharacterized protein LOC143522464 isoform X2 [Brachyhypopomus gauderio]|uniref:uncharacterized protein LOC143522464 isoform X2 n=1 Tax=Brachyhypopomus gauderio TaxID=698409 RepID=UPI004042204A